MHDSKHHRSHEITIRRCTEGCLVLQFGLTMVHLDIALFQRFAQIVMATSVQLNQEQKQRQVAQLSNGCGASLQGDDLDRGYEA